MARTKHERTLQRKRERQAKTGEEEGKEDVKGRAERSDPRGAGNPGVENSTAQEISDMGEQTASPADDEGAVEKDVSVACEGEQGGTGEMVDARGDKLTTARAHGSADPRETCDQAVTTEGNCKGKEVASESVVGLSQDAIDSLLERLETEISTRRTPQTKTAESPDGKTLANSQEQQLCVHEEQLQRLQAQLEQALRREEMLAAENVEWKRASEKQHDFRGEIQATHVLRRTQAVQLRRVAGTLETAGHAAGDALSALHTIADALYPCEADQSAKGGSTVACDTMVFPAQHTSSCNCGRGSCRWPVKKEEGDFTDEYAFRIFRLAEEPLKKRRYTSLASLHATESAFKTDDASHASQVATILEDYEQKMSGHFIYEPPTIKRRRMRGRPSSDNEGSSADDGDLSDTSLEVVLSAVDPTTPVHPGSEDAFSMVAL